LDDSFPAVCIRVGLEVIRVVYKLYNLYRTSIYDTTTVPIIEIFIHSLYNNKMHHNIINTINHIVVISHLRPVEQGEMCAEPLNDPSSGCFGGGWRRGRTEEEWPTDIVLYYIAMRRRLRRLWRRRRVVSLYRQSRLLTGSLIIYHAHCTYEYYNIRIHIIIIVIVYDVGPVFLVHVVRRRADRFPNNYIQTIIIIVQ